MESNRYLPVIFYKPQNEHSPIDASTDDDSMGTDLEKVAELSDAAPSETPAGTSDAAIALVSDKLAVNELLSEVIAARLSVCLVQTVS